MGEDQTPEKWRTDEARALLTSECLWCGAQPYQWCADDCQGPGSGSRAPENADPRPFLTAPVLRETGKAARTAAEALVALLNAEPCDSYVGSIHLPRSHPCRTCGFGRQAHREMAEPEVPDA